MVEATVMAGEAMAAAYALRALGNQKAYSLGFRFQVGANIQALAAAIAPAENLRETIVRQHQEPPKPEKPDETWAPWTPEKVAAEERARDAEWAEVRSQPVTVRLPGLAWGQLAAEDAKQAIGGDLLGAISWLLTGAPAVDGE